MKTVAKKIGRPSIWTAELEDAVIAAIADTGSQTEAAGRCGIHRQRIDERELADETFRSRIARAREIGYAARAEKAVQDAKAAPDAAKGRLAFDAERWLLSKLDPRRYGDRTTLAGDPESPLQVRSSRELTDAELVAIAAGGAGGGE